MKNQGWTYRDRITSRDRGLTVLDFYSQRYRHSSPADWWQRIVAGQILLDDRPTTPETPLQVGQRLAYHRPPWEEPSVPLEFTVLYEDEDVLAIAKPAGLPVLPGGGFVEHTLLHQLSLRYPQSTPVPVHRLGRGTSGLLLLARSPLSRANLSRQFRDTSGQQSSDRCVQKLYRALIGPCDLPDSFVLTTPIGKLPHPTLGYIYGAVPDGQPGGKPAYSEGRILQRRADSTLVEVAIHTGRPHQIRIHLAAAGYPLLGDPLYQVGGMPRLAIVTSDQPMAVPGDIGYHLHAYRLTFRHPRSDRSIDLRCPPPPPLCLASDQDCQV